MHLQRRLSSSSHSGLPEISDSPNQSAGNIFPKRQFGRSKVVSRSLFKDNGSISGAGCIMSQVQTWLFATHA